MGAWSWSETGQEWEQDSRLRCQMVFCTKAREDRKLGKAWLNML
jgi:hypothetical protein